MNTPSTAGKSQTQFRLGLLGLAACLLAWPAISRGQGDARLTRAQVLAHLKTRQAQQTQAAAAFHAFHDFRFTDQAASSGIRFTQVPVDDARKNWTPAHYDHGNGVAVADVDGDGRLDLYFITQLGGNELYRNLGKGKFENITAASGLALTDQISVAGSFGDMDNDGDPDLMVTTVRMGNHLFENLGGGKFKDVTKAAGVDYSGHSSGAVWLDYDRDGLLDLFVANVGVYTKSERGAGGFYLAVPDAFASHLIRERNEESLLYRNLGGGKFQNVSDTASLRDGAWSGDATMCDVNQDSFPDLYVVNMQGDDHCYVNEGGRRFVDQTAKYFPKTPWGSMSAQVFDCNNDGLMDVFVADMHSDMTDTQTTAGLKFELGMEKRKSESWCSVVWTDAFLQGASNNIFGNAFYLNKGGGIFEEISAANGTETYWPWGASVGDLNADGFEDLFVSAGMGYPFRYAINSLLLNEAGRRFFDAEFLTGIEPRPNNRVDKIAFTLNCQGDDRNHPLCQGQSGSTPIRGALSTRSSAIFDLDDDGDLDIVTTEFNDGPQVLISNLAERKPVKFLKVRLAGSASNRDGLGATVKIHAGGQVFTRFHSGKSGYLTQSLIPLYAGLGAASSVDKIEVRWPSGRDQTVPGPIEANRLITVQEPAASPAN